MYKVELSMEILNYKPFNIKQIIGVCLFHYFIFKIILTRNVAEAALNNGSA